MALGSFDKVKMGLAAFASSVAIFLGSGCEAASSENFVVAVDIGHSSGDPGALSARGVPEYAFNKCLASALYESLKKNGYTKSFLINENGDLNGAEGVRERTRIAEDRKADLLISIHHDSVKEQFLKTWKYEGTSRRYSDEFAGYSIVVSKGSRCSEKSIEFATCLGDELLKRKMTPTMYHALDIPGERRRLIDRKRGIYDIDFWVVDKAAMPSVLIEAGIIVNRKEEKKLSSYAYIDKIVDGIVNAIKIYSSANVSIK